MVSSNGLKFAAVLVAVGVSGNAYASVTLDGARTLIVMQSQYPDGSWDNVVQLGEQSINHVNPNGDYLSASSTSNPTPTLSASVTAYDYSPNLFRGSSTTFSYNWTITAPSQAAADFSIVFIRRFMLTASIR